MLPPREWSRGGRFLGAGLATAALSGASWAAFGPRAGLAVALLGYVFTAWVADDAPGNCFVFAMLFLLIVAVVVVGLAGAVALNS